MNPLRTSIQRPTGHLLRCIVILGGTIEYVSCHLDARLPTLLRDPDATTNQSRQDHSYLSKAVNHHRHPLTPTFQMVLPFP